MIDNNKQNPTNEIEAMFVQTATSAVGQRGRLTLRGLAPSTLYFSDRPQRVVGHISNRQFVDLWGEGVNSFREDPPNAVLAFLDEGDRRPEDLVITLREPSLVGDELTYDIQVLESSLPAKSGPCTLFIDPLGRPLSPVSVAGVHRRTRRAERRML